jgi:hypothetical protein
VSAAAHSAYCDWHHDQYPWECTCGATAPKAPWFDEYVQACEARRSSGSHDMTTRIVVEPAGHRVQVIITDGDDEAARFVCMPGERPTPFWVHGRQVLTICELLEA